MYAFDAPWAIGLASGMLVAVAILSVLTAVALRERGLHAHAAACALAAVTSNSVPLALTALVPAGLVGIMGMAAMHARGLATEVGSFRPHRRAMSAVAVALAAISILALVHPASWLLLPATVLLGGLEAAVLSRLWSRSRDWVALVAAGQLMLLGIALWVGLAPRWRAHPLLIACALSVWGFATFVASASRSRHRGEQRSKAAAARREDPITRLATELVLDERIQAARAHMRRFSHPTSILLLHVDELDRIAQRLGPREAEAATLEAGVRLGLALSRADIAARVGDFRFAVLAEGSSPEEVAQNLAGRILVAGLKRQINSVPGVFLHFRIVVAAVPVEDGSTQELLHKLARHLDHHVQRARERRIHVLASVDAPAGSDAPSSGGSGSGAQGPLDTVALDR